MTNIPVSGITFENQQETVEKVANAKAFQYRKIGYYDTEDLKQEIRIKCWSVINRYDPNSGTNLFVFLSVCADNRLRDIRRSVIYKHNKPCFRCPFWHKGAAASGVHDCLVYYNKMDCDRFAKHERYTHAKISSSQPIDIDTQRIEDHNYGVKQREVEINEMVESKLPNELVPLFRKFKSYNFDTKMLKAREKSILLNTLRNLFSRKDFML